MTVGRPSTYDPSYCEQVVEYGKAGKSVTWIAATIGVTRATVYNWMEEHPEFLDAITRSQEAAQLWWEDAGQSGLREDKFNASIWSRSMAARFPKDWRENKGVELSGGVQIETTTKEQRDASVAAAMRADA